MAQNKKHWAYSGGSIDLALPVPVGSKSGDLVILGTDGLYGWCQTDRVTADQVTKGEHPQGFVEGQAGVFLPGIVVSVNVVAAQIAAVAQFGKVYVKADRTLTGTALNNTFVGYKLGANFIGLRAN